MTRLYLPSYSEGIDYTTPDPPALTFTPGQTSGDIQCVNITIIDDPLPQGERNLSISLGNGTVGDGGGVGGGGGVRVHPDSPTINIDITLDLNDSKFGLNYCEFWYDKGTPEACTIQLP